MNRIIQYLPVPASRPVSPIVAQAREARRIRRALRSVVGDACDIYFSSSRPWMVRQDGRASISAVCCDRSTVFLDRDPAAAIAEMAGDLRLMAQRLMHAADRLDELAATEGGAA